MTARGTSLQVIEDMVDDVPAKQREALEQALKSDPESDRDCSVEARDLLRVIAGACISFSAREQARDLPKKRRRQDINAVGNAAEALRRALIKLSPSDRLEFEAAWVGATGPQGLVASVERIGRGLAWLCSEDPLNPGPLVRIEHAARRVRTEIDPTIDDDPIDGPLETDTMLRSRSHDFGQFVLTAAVHCWRRVNGEWPSGSNPEHDRQSFPLVVASSACVATMSRNIALVAQITFDNYLKARAAAK
ncbi:MAG: hypothetical protein ABMA14_25725 [Hyphomonadaceae bacterium]